jgi:3-methyladenine DNA glycosylase AlkD
MPATSRLLRRLRAALRAAGDPVTATGAQAYMKSAMPHHGVKAGPFRAICRETFAGLEFADSATWQARVLDIWEHARYREERHAAIELTGARAARRFQDMTALPLYERLVVEGAWWDYVDGIAAHRLGPLLRNQPRPMRKAMLAWARGQNMWKRRSAILCQLTFKDDTDLELLYACIEPSIGSEEFFLRKGIGWALRALAWRAPEEVVRYVRARREVLSPLTKREALKNVLKAGRIDRIP